MRWLRVMTGFVIVVIVGGCLGAVWSLGTGLTLQMVLGLTVTVVIVSGIVWAGWSRRRVEKTPYW